MHVETCYFYEGRHFGPEGCYHTRAESILNEFGVEKPPGWTVQSESRNPAYWKKEFPQEG